MKCEIDGSIRSSKADFFQERLVEMSRKVQWPYEVVVHDGLSEDDIILVLASNPVQAIDKARKIHNFDSLHDITVTRYLPGSLKEMIL